MTNFVSAKYDKDTGDQITDPSDTRNNPYVNSIQWLKLSTQAARKNLHQDTFNYWQLTENPIGTFVPNTGSVVYIDPTGGAGSGTFASPLNAPPVGVDNTTYLYKEGTRTTTTANLTGFTAVGCVIGTYDAATGARVLDKNRLATIDGATFFRCAIRWQGTSSTFTLSGIRIVGALNAAGGIQLFESITAPVTSTITVEHCVFEDIGSYQLVSGALNNQAITVQGARVVARFNYINIPGDGVFYTCSTTAGTDIYCNQIIVPTTTTNSGPDGIQYFRSGTTAIGRHRVYKNWIEINVNEKAGIVVSGGTPQASGDFVDVYNNLFFGVDTAKNPPLGPDTQSHIAVNIDSLSGIRIWGNYFDEWAGWATVSNAGVLMNNIAVRTHTGAFFTGFATSTASSGAFVCNNTVVFTGAFQIGTSTAFEIQGSGAQTVKNNVIVGAWIRGMRIGATGTTESYNLFDGPLNRLVNGSNVDIALAATSKIAISLLDPVGRVLVDSPLTGTGNVVRGTSNMVLRFTDIFGAAAIDPLIPNIGAANRVLQ